MRGCPIKLGNLIMKAILLACTLASFSAPAFAQTACPHREDPATEEFVAALRGASNALSTKDFGRALALTAIARPEAYSQRQKIAVTQLEIVAVSGMKDRETAARLMTGVLPDPCLPEQSRANYLVMLTQWGMHGN